MIKTTRRRTQIDIETHEILVIRKNGERTMPVCEHCGQGPTSSDQVPAVPVIDGQRDGQTRICQNDNVNGKAAAESENTRGD